MILEFNLKTF